MKLMNVMIPLGLQSTRLDWEGPFLGPKTLGVVPCHHLVGTPDPQHMRTRTLNSETHVIVLSCSLTCELADCSFLVGVLVKT